MDLILASIFRDVINEWYVADPAAKSRPFSSPEWKGPALFRGPSPHGYLAYSKKKTGEWDRRGKLPPLCAASFRWSWTVRAPTASPSNAAGRANPHPFRNTGSVSAVLFEPTATATPTHGLPPPWVIFLKGRSTWGARCWARLSVRTTRLKAPAGQCQRNNLYFEGAVPAIIDEETWHNVQRLRETKRRTPKRVMPLTV